MIITTHGPDPEPEAMGKTCAIAARWTGYDAKIYTAERTAAGWLEYGISIINYHGKQAFYIALIQREPSAAWESHS